MVGGDFSSRLMTEKLVFAIWGLCWYHFFLKLNVRNKCQATMDPKEIEGFDWYHL